jgi:hypothetical protein
MTGWRWQWVRDRTLSAPYSRDTDSDVVGRLTASGAAAVGVASAKAEGGPCVRMSMLQAPGSSVGGIHVSKEPVMMSQVVVDAINSQINSELSAHYAYLAMSAYCQRANFTN